MLKQIRFVSSLLLFGKSKDSTYGVNDKNANITFHIYGAKVLLNYIGLQPDFVKFPFYISRDI